MPSSPWERPSKHRDAIVACVVNWGRLLLSILRGCFSVAPSDKSFPRLRAVGHFQSLSRRGVSLDLWKMKANPIPLCSPFHPLPSLPDYSGVKLSWVKSRPLIPRPERSYRVCLPRWGRCLPEEFCRKLFPPRPPESNNSPLWGALQPGQLFLQVSGQARLHAGPQFPHLQNGDNDGTLLTGLS